MADFVMVDGHRVFDDTCEHADHQPGDRHRDGVGLDSEWDGRVWGPVCPVCDVQMSGRDDRGYLMCALCLNGYLDLARADKLQLAQWRDEVPF